MAFIFKINGIDVETDGTKTILECAEENGIEIPNLCRVPGLAPYGGCGVCVVEEKKDGVFLPKLIRSCAQYPREGGEYYSDSERAVSTRKLALSLMMSDHGGDCVGPCELACPAHTECKKYVNQIACGDFEGAAATVRKIIPLPSSIGRICPHPCEKDCRRQNVENSVSIAALKAFASDYTYKTGSVPHENKMPSNGKTVGIIGAGPAGLAAAYRLVKRGFAVTVYDKMPKAGGMLRYGIPEYRLPKAVLDKEIKELENYGIKIVCDFTVGKDATLDELKAKYDAILLSNGAWKSSSIRCKGEDLKNVYGGIDFLREAALGRAPFVGDVCAVVGGGNTAMDACRTAVRLGAKNVYIIYRRTADEMPAEKIEIAEAGEEGVQFLFLSNPDEIIADENGAVKTVKIQKMRLGEPDERGRARPVPIEGEFINLPVSSVIIAAGQKNDPAGFEGIPVTKYGTIEVNGDMMTAVDGVFAAGDNCGTGASIAIAAIDEGNRAADGITEYLTGVKTAKFPEILSKRELSEIDFSQYEKKARAVTPVLPAEERKNCFKEVASILTQADAVNEAKRCLECGCHDYGNCRLIDYAQKNCVDCKRFCGEKRADKTERKLVYVERNPAKCILCGACVRVCKEKAKKGLLGLYGRGFTTSVRPEFENVSVTEFCKDCGECEKACPTGALKITDK